MLGFEANTVSWSYFSSVKSAGPRSTSNLYAGSKGWRWVLRYSGACTPSMRSTPSRFFLLSLSTSSVSWVYQRTDDKVSALYLSALFKGFFLIETDALLGLGNILCDFLYIIFPKDISRPLIETLPLNS